MRDILMPQNGKSVTSGTIKKWLKQAGETVQQGDVIAQIETQEGIVILEAAEGGTIDSIVVLEGKTAKVGEKLAELKGQVVESVNKEAKPEQATKAGNVSNQTVIPILMPQAGNSMEEGTVVKWRVKEGDRITVGQVILEVETDKATLEVEATDAGRVAKIVAGEGAVVPVKQPVAYLSEGEIDLASSTIAINEQPRETAKTQSEVSAPETVSPSTTSSTPIFSDGRVKASPAARKLAQDKGLDLASVGVGSGPGGRILSSDLARATSASAAPGKSQKAKAPEIAPLGRLSTTQIVRRKMSKMRRAIAANLQASKQNIPHFYLRATINADAMMAYYKAAKAKYPCSINDVVTLACAGAIVEFPALRSRIDKDEIVEYPTVNIGVAVGVEDGLTVPVLLNTHEMNLQQIAAGTKRIVESARNGKLEGFGQGSFTITNLGMFGVEEFAAIVNPPEPAILAVGAAREAVIVKDGAMKPGRVMTMTLSCDHRLVDGLLAAKFMARLKELLENPTVLGE